MFTNFKIIKYLLIDSLNLFFELFYNFFRNIDRN